ncbi:MAG: 3-hydroxyacyl-CoA dehydrogenase family protein, partial [Longimicrobiales bacterium]
MTRPTPRASRGASRAGPARRITVIGAGTMGHGIAQVCALAGHAVTLADTSADIAAHGVERIRANLDGAVERGKLTPVDHERTLARIRTLADTTAACRDADIVIEAVPERLDVKLDVLARIEQSAPPGAVIATNTSSLSINEMQT